MLKTTLNTRHGFTIVEVLIVVVVIAILTGITIVAYRGITGDARESALKSDLKTVSDKVHLINLKDRKFPAVGAVDIPAGLNYTSDDDTFCVWGSANGKDFRVDESGNVENGRCELGIASISVGIGSNHTCSIATSGWVYCWGDNSYGQLGNGQSGFVNSKNVPVAVSSGAIPDGIIAKQITGGKSHNCILGFDGQVYCWGRNDYGQLGDGTTSNKSAPVLVSKGAIPLNANILNISAGHNYTCALDTSNKAYCWGENLWGQLGDGTVNGSPTPVAVIQGSIPASTVIGDIVAGVAHTCVVATNSKSYCWGNGSYGQLGDNTTANRLTPAAVLQGDMEAGVSIKKIAISSTSTCALATDNGVYCWGYNSRGQLGNGAAGTSRSLPVAVLRGAIPDGVNVKTIASGYDHYCVVGYDSKAYCWGFDANGQLGDGTTNIKSTPVSVLQGAIPVTANIVEIDASEKHTCALASDKRSYCWGYNNFGQLGDGTSGAGSDKTAPVQVLPSPSI